MPLHCRSTAIYSSLRATFVLVTMAFIVGATARAAGVDMAPADVTVERLARADVARTAAVASRGPEVVARLGVSDERSIAVDDERPSNYGALALAVLDLALWVGTRLRRDD